MNLLKVFEYTWNLPGITLGAMAQFLGVWEARKERWVPKNDLSLLYFCLYHFKGLRGSHQRSAILMRGTIAADQLRPLK